MQIDGGKFSPLHDVQACGLGHRDPRRLQGVLDFLAVGGVCVLRNFDRPKEPYVTLVEEVIVSEGWRISRREPGEPIPPDASLEIHLGWNDPSPVQQRPPPPYPVPLLIIPWHGRMPPDNATPPNAEVLVNFGDGSADDAWTEDVKAFLASNEARRCHLIDFTTRDVGPIEDVIVGEGWTVERLLRKSDGTVPALAVYVDVPRTNGQPADSVPGVPNFYLFSAAGPTSVVTFPLPFKAAAASVSAVCGHPYDGDSSSPWADDLRVFLHDNAPAPRLEAAQAEASPEPDASKSSVETDRPGVRRAAIWNHTTGGSIRKLLDTRPMHEVIAAVGAWESIEPSLDRSGNVPVRRDVDIEIGISRHWTKPQPAVPALRFLDPDNHRDSRDDDPWTRRRHADSVYTASVDDDWAEELRLFLQDPNRGPALWAAGRALQAIHQVDVEPTAEQVRDEEPPSRPDQRDDVAATDAPSPAAPPGERRGGSSSTSGLGSRVFISYRRADADADATALYMTLRAEFGADAIFKDVDNVAYGQDWREAVRGALQQSSALLVIMGPTWMSEHGHRLSDEDDPIRFELDLAAQLRLPVIPVLVRDAQMGRAQEFPEALRWLSYRNGPYLRHTTWDRDVAPLLNALRGMVNAGTGSARSVPKEDEGISIGPPPDGP